jgi:NAD(P)-dependent dehydrogenase (short-subunit alcohol dehydrogenase family)
MSGAALVTGAGGGLGLAIARALAARGMAVHLTDVDAEAVAAHAAEIGGDAWGSRLDVRDAEACRTAAADTAERAGSLDVWVNNAGILVTGLAWELTEDERRNLFEVNTMGTINGTCAALEQMRPAGQGHVINVISLAGLVAAPGEAMYASTKHAAIAFTLGTLFDLRRSGVKRIHLSAVCPDGVWSPMLHGRLDDPEAAASFSGKMLMPEEVAEHVAALLQRPRPLIVLPRWRGVVVRAFDAWPRLVIASLPLLFGDARRRQRGFKRRVESGRWPPS